MTSLLARLRRLLDAVYALAYPAGVARTALELLDADARENKKRG